MTRRMCADSQTCAPTGNTGVGSNPTLYVRRAGGEHQGHAAAPAVFDRRRTVVGRRNDRAAVRPRREDREVRSKRIARAADAVRRPSRASPLGAGTADPSRATGRRPSGASLLAGASAAHARRATAWGSDEPQPPAQTTAMPNSRLRPPIMLCREARRAPPTEARSYDDEPPGGQARRDTNVAVAGQATSDASAVGGPPARSSSVASGAVVGSRTAPRTAPSGRPRGSGRTGHRRSC